MSRGGYAWSVKNISSITEHLRKAVDDVMRPDSNLLHMNCYDMYDLDAFLSKDTNSTRHGIVTSGLEMFHYLVFPFA